MKNFNNSSDFRKRLVPLAAMFTFLGGGAACTAAPAPVTPANIISHSPALATTGGDVFEGELARRRSGNYYLVDGWYGVGDESVAYSAKYHTGPTGQPSAANFIAADVKRFRDMPGTANDISQEGAIRHLGGNDWRIYRSAGDFSKSNAASGYPAGPYTECGNTATTCNQAYMSDLLGAMVAIDDLK
jgi:hypothetical protein